MFILILTIILFLSGHSGYELKQVVVLSRHNIRAPLMTNVELLSPKKWPSWNMDFGSLTPKGCQLEFFMGKYFSNWMNEERLFDNSCPSDQVLVYANVLPRTEETAKSFARGAFGDCVGVYYKNDTKFDPMFATIVRNTSINFKDAVLKEINTKLNNTDLSNAFLELNWIVDFGNSSYCRTEKVCNLNEAKSEFVFEIKQYPHFIGALEMGWSLVDWFLMAYYNGMAPEDVAWGQIQTTKQWENIMQIPIAFTELHLTIKSLATDLASPMLEYLTDVFQNGKKKLYVLVGHDVNIIVLRSFLGFKDYVLHDQLETTPIGGKVVFQKWYDEKNDQYLLRVNYVYMSTKQIRDGAEVSVQNPPQWQIMEMENCALDADGYCPWNNFISILNTV